MTYVLLALAGLFIVALLLGIQIVPQSENHLVERFGRYQRTLHAGINFTIPFLERVPETGKISVVERQLPNVGIPAITLDNVTIHLDLAILYRIVDAAKVVYRIQNLEYAIQSVVIGCVRSVIGKTELDGVQSNRRTLSQEIFTDLSAVADEWGVVLSRVEIVDVAVDAETKAAMSLQLNADRTRRALIREAEGRKEATMLQSDANLYAAQREAEAEKVRADAQAYALKIIAGAISEGGAAAAEFEIRKVQAGAVATLGKDAASKIVLLPSDVLDGVKGAARRLTGA